MYLSNMFPGDQCRWSRGPLLQTTGPKVAVFCFPAVASVLLTGFSASLNKIPQLLVVRLPAPVFCGKQGLQREDRQYSRQNNGPRQHPCPNPWAPGRTCYMEKGSKVAGGIKL